MSDVPKSAYDENVTTNEMPTTQAGKETDDLSTWFWNLEDQGKEDAETRRLKFLKCAGFRQTESDEESLHESHSELNKLSKKYSEEGEEEESESDEGESWFLHSDSSVSTLSSDGYLDVEIDSEDFLDLDDVDYSESDISLVGGGLKKSKEIVNLPRKFERSGNILEAEREPTQNEYGFGEDFSHFLSRLYKLGNIDTGIDNGKGSDEDDRLSTESDCEYIRGSDDVENCAGWKRLCYLPDPWAEARYPTSQFISRQELTSENLKRNVNTIMIANGLTNLTIPPGCTNFACTKLQLQGMGIRSVDQLAKYKFLQYIDLTMNEITELKPIWEVQHLVVLDVSYNFVNECTFGTPQSILFLTYLNLSHNDFTQIPDLNQCWSLKHLNLSHNRIKYIENLDCLGYLEYLNISSNELEVITNLTNVQLVEVDFSFNQITEWNNPSPSTLCNLKIVNIASNLLPTLRIFKHMYNLRKFDASNNEFSEMSDFECLRTFPRMEDLRLHGNELMKIIADARRLIIYYMPSLKRLDDSPISSMERVSSHSTFALNSMDSMIMQDSLNFYSMHCQNPTIGWERKKPIGHTPALILLVGFLGSLREEIVRKAVQMRPYKIRVIRQATTRPAVKNPSSKTLYSTNLFYKHMSQSRFHRMEARGDFLVTYLDLGYKFGFETGDLENIDKVSITLVSMPAASSLIWQGFQPYTFLVFPDCSEILSTRLCTWFRNTHVFRSDSHTRLLRGRRRKRSRRKRTLVSLRLDDDEGVTLASSRITSVSSSPLWMEEFGKRLNRRKRKYPNKRLHRMLTSVRKNSRTMYGSKVSRFRKGRSQAPSIFSIYSAAPHERRKPDSFRDPIFRRNMEHIFSRGLSHPFSQPWCQSHDKKKVAFKGTYSSPAGSVSQSSRPSFYSRETREEGSFSAFIPELKDSKGDHEELARFVKNIYKLRQSYREMHRKNPGFFHSYINSDDTSKAAEILVEKVDEIYEKLMQYKKSDNEVLMRDSPYFEELVMKPINEYINDICAHDEPQDIIK